MANNVHKYGFRFYQGSSGRDRPTGLPMQVANAYQAKADDTTTSVDLNVGDPVKLVSDGSVALANATDVPYGIVTGILNVFNSADGANRPNNRVPGATTPGTTAIDRQTTVLVTPCEGVIWEVDVDDNTTQTTYTGYQGIIGNNIGHSCVADTSNSGLPKADPRLKMSTLGTVGTLDWRIVGISKTADNKDFSGTNVKLLVKANTTNEAGHAAVANVIAGV